LTFLSTPLIYYNTVSSLYAANNVKQLILKEEKLYTLISDIEDHVLLGYSPCIDITNSDIGDNTYFNRLKEVSNIEKIYFSTYEIDDSIINDDSLNANLLFIDYLKSIKNSTFSLIPGAYRVIVIMEDDTFSNVVIGNDIPNTNLVLHLDANIVKGYEDGEEMTQWNDLSGNNNHFFQYSGSSYKPSYKLNGLNGKPVISFNADYFRLGTNIIGNTTFFPDASDAFSIFLVGKASGGDYSGNKGAFISKAGGTGGTSTYVLYYHGDTNQFSHVLRGEINSSPGHNGWALHSAVWDGSNHFYSVDGGSDLDHNNVGTAVNQSTGIAIGGAANGDNTRLIGEIAEVIVYDRALSEEERKQVEKYLGHKWFNWEN